jgi:predicted GH43/DUF377 family glycosyl hydrolase
MLKLTRYPHNPIFIPDEKNEWEKSGTFNGCVAKLGDSYHLLYRALSSSKSSSIGYAKAEDFFAFADREILVKPDSDWDRFGCEDPRVTFLDGIFYIFYTGLSTQPLTPDSIKICLAKTRDFTSLEKHPVTTFNSKAMALFPEKINGKFAAVLTVSTDRPPLPAKIAVAYFDNEEDIWSKEYWDKWFSEQDKYSLPLLRDSSHQIEVGAPPIKTESGWVFFYSYTKNYFSNDKAFGIEAALLDLNSPHNVVARTSEAMLTPEADYELYGEVPKVVFPSGALLDGNTFWVFYGSADYCICLASCEKDILLKDLLMTKSQNG